MRRFALLMVVAVGGLACDVSELDGQQRPIDLVIRNNYAESIFTVAVTPDTDLTERVVVDQERVNGHRSRTFRDAIDVPGAKFVDLRVRTISAGSEHEFTVPGIELRPNGTVTIEYDYDLALLKFRVGVRSL